MATRKSKSYWPTGVRARGYTQTIGELVANFAAGTYRMNDMQRGDTYTDKQRNDLIASVLQRIPIGEITLMKNSDDADGEFDVLDGVRVPTVIATAKELAFNRDDIWSDILATARDFTRTELLGWLRRMPSAYRSEYRAMRAEGVI